MSDMPPATEAYMEAHMCACPAQEAGFGVPLGHLYEATISDTSVSIPLIGEGNQTGPLIDLCDDDLPNVHLATDGYPPKYPEASEHGGKGEIPLQLTLPERTILDYDHTLKNCLARNNVHMMCIPIAPDEDDPFTAKTADSTVDEVMHILMSQTHHSIFVHCVGGKHHTGVMVGCFRKVQGWSHSNIISEYRSFAGDRARSSHEAFIQAYTPGRGICKAGKRLNVASWVVLPDRLRTDYPGKHLPLAQN
ncbi:tyrosine-protein phosphatase siw14 [Penicillium ochrochloron]